MKKQLLDFYKKTTTLVVLTLLLVVAAYQNKAWSQVSAYTVQQLQLGTTVIPAGTPLFATTSINVDNGVANVTLPFAFNFNATSYTSINVSLNGFITFGATAPSLTNIAPIATGEAYAGAISVFGRDLDLLPGNTVSNVFTSVTGTAPNRQFIIGYNVRRGTLPTNTVWADTSGNLLMQIVLFETTNVIELRYGTFAPGGLFLGPGQIGLRGSSVTDFNILTHPQGSHWPGVAPAPVGVMAAGTTNADVVNVRSTATQIVANSNRLFRFTPPPCFGPSSPNSFFVLHNRANCSFAPAGTPPGSGYDWEIRTSPGGVLVDSGNVLNSPIVPSGNLLSPGTSYIYRVRSNCGATQGAWQTSPVFTTRCVPENTFYGEYIDASTTAYPAPIAPALPQCTQAVIASGTNNWFTSDPTVLSNSLGMLDNHLRFTTHPVNNSNAWYFTHGVNLTAGQNYYLKYDYTGSAETSAITNRMEVRYGLLPFPAQMAAATQLDNHPNIKALYNTNTVNFTAPTTGVYYFGFRCYSDANNGSLFLDNIEVSESTCAPVTSVVVPPSQVTFSSALITWTPPAPPPVNGYVYLLSTTNTPPANNTPGTGTIGAGSSSFLLTGLAPSTTYYIWIRGECDFEGLGQWSPVATFTTLAAPPVYCTPVGTSVDGQGITNVTFGSINNTTGSEAATGFYGNYSNLVTNIGQGESQTLTATFSTGSFDYSVRIWVDWNNNGSFLDPGEVVFSGLTVLPSPSIINAVITVPLSQPLGQRRLRIGGIDIGTLTDPCRNGSWQTFEDYTINVVVAPPPLTISSSGSTQCANTASPLVTITTPLSNYDSYTWSPAIGVTGTAASGFTFTNNTTTTYILTASQSSGDFSVKTVSFTYTATPAPTPITINTPSGTASCQSGPGIPLVAVGGGVPNNIIFNENFNSGLTGWTTTNTSVPAPGTVAAWGIRSSPHLAGGSFFTPFVSNDNSQFVMANADALGSGTTTNVTLVSPPIDLTTIPSGGTASLQFFHFFRQWFQDATVVVQVGNSVTGPWTTLQSYLGTNQGTTNNFAPANINLNAYIGQTIHIRFQYVTTFGWAWAIDNFTVFGSTSQITWSPTTGLFTDAALTTPYTGGFTNTVFAATGVNQTYTAMAQVTTPVLCQAMATVDITGTPVVAGTVTNGGQNNCDTSTFTNLVLTGHTGNIIRWESADNAAFTIGLTSIPNTTTTLTPAEFGTINGVKYFRAVVGSGTCNNLFTPGVTVTVPTTIWNGSAWSNGVPTLGTQVVFAGNFNSTGNIDACSVRVNNGAQVIFNSNHTLRVANAVTVQDLPLPTVLRFMDDASLVQINGTTNNNVGPIYYRRQTTPMRQFDYTYWSSPVENQNVGAFSPDTRFDKYLTWNNVFPAYNWQSVPPAITSMIAAKGYIFRAPDIAPWIPFAPGNAHSFTGEFFGRPHNGTYTTPILVSGANNLNLIGNPYPSAIFADEFIFQNLPAQGGVTGGTIYLWTHNTPIVGNNYASNDYASYNLVGGVGTGVGTAAGSTPCPGCVNGAPDGFIAAGQSFFIQGQSNGNATFRNNMRVVGNNAEFYRNTSGTPQVYSSVSTLFEKHRIWIDLVGPQAAFKQTLIGYISGATNDIDFAFDGDHFDAGNVVNIYSIEATKKLAIQGRALPFEETDVVPLGYKVTFAGNFQIVLSQFDGLFDSQNVYVKDNLLNITHDLKAAPYDFVSAVGTFDARFEILFSNQVLGVTSPNFDDAAVIAFKDASLLTVTTANFTIKDIKVFDVRGSLLAQATNVNDATHSFATLPSTQQVLLVQVTNTDGVTVTKKVVF